MPITPDQRATLQLLLERGQSYDDLAGLLGQDAAQVRARARAALTELGGADPDRSVGLTDYLLGQADPIGRADASRHLREDPEDRRLASELGDRLRELFPAAELPRLPGEPRAPARRRLPRPARESGLTQSQTRLIVVAASAAVLVIAIVLGVTGAFSGGDDEATAGGTSTTAGDTSTTASQSDERAVPVPLTAEKGSDAAGAVIFGFATADQPYIEFKVRSLEPPANGDVYVLWFLLGNGQGFPLPTPLNVSANGSLDDRVPVPASVLSFVQQAQSIAIALNDAKQLDDDIQRALDQQQGALDFPGGTVLSADLQGAAKGAASPDS